MTASAIHARACWESLPRRLPEGLIERIPALKIGDVSPTAPQEREDAAKAPESNATWGVVRPGRGALRTSATEKEVRCA